MARVTKGPTGTGQKALEIEIARLRDLNTRELQARWRILFRGPAPPHLSDQLLFRIIAYRQQADQFGDLDGQCLRLLDNRDSVRADSDRTPKLLSAKAEQGTILTREWNGRMHRVAVVSDGFAWNGKTYTSLSKVAFTITGTRWNGPRFFGLRDRQKTQSAGPP
jgi:Protein of unknown function (DUF2924)